MEKSRMLCCDFSVRFFGSIFRFDFSVRLSGSIFRFDFASVFCKGIVERGKGVAFFFFLLAILWPKTHGACIALTFFFFLKRIFWMFLLGMAGLLQCFQKVLDQRNFSR